VTNRFQAIREGAQECEARIYLEAALTDKALRAKLSQEMASWIQQALDERIRMCLNAQGEGEPWFISSGWNARTEVLFSLAAEISRKLGREPTPNLTPRAQ